MASGRGRFDAKDWPVGDSGWFGLGLDFDNAHVWNARLFQIDSSTLLNGISNLRWLQDFLPVRRYSHG